MTAARTRRPTHSQVLAARVSMLADRLNGEDTPADIVSIADAEPWPDDEREELERLRPRSR